jgi:hypothetical protein
LHCWSRSVVSVTVALLWVVVEVVEVVLLQESRLDVVLVVGQVRHLITTGECGRRATIAMVEALISLRVGNNKIKNYE